MGYCYTNDGRLCCDGCNQPGNGVRKRKCPHGYCPPPALCDDCNKKYPRDHAKCKVRSAEYKAEREYEARLIAAGAMLRCSALGYGREIVHVIFRGKAGESGSYMKTATYHAVPLGVPATPEDYARHGQLIAAPVNFYHGADALQRAEADLAAAGGWQSVEGAPAYPSRAAFIAENRRQLEAVGLVAVDAVCNDDGNCTTCGESGRCPGVHPEPADVFTLRNEAPKAPKLPKPEPMRQAVLFAGLECLPGQNDLFETDGSA